MQKSRILPCCLLILVLAGGEMLFARDVEITVRDGDLEIPLEGALIRSWDGKEYLCDAEGKALVDVPDDRQVVIQGGYPGYANGRLVIGPGADRFTLALRLSGIMENKELVIEASRPGVSESRPGRSVALTEKEIARTAEIGIEDVMTSIKLLPGVGYAGVLDPSRPSIRGGDPGDLTAVLDGFYVEYPYFWGGTSSIFDPRMTQSAQLSHGVFSARYGHTISGLLEVTSKKPSPTERDLELGFSSRDAKFNLSLPILGKGGIMVMGNWSYDGLMILAFKQAAKVYEPFEIVNAYTTPSYTRSLALSGNYPLGHKLELTLNGFYGGFGIGFDTEGVDDIIQLKALWKNYQLFGIAGLTYNPRSDMALKFSLGGGGLREKWNSKVPTNFTFYGYTYDYDVENISSADNRNFQGRIDYDWDIGPVPGLLFAAGVQELYSKKKGELEYKYSNIDPLPPSWYSGFDYSDDTEKSREFDTSLYALLEYDSPKKPFGIELGIRLDHSFYKDIKEGFEVGTKLIPNPRLNVDFTPVKNKGIIESLMLTAGIGLFSSTSDVVKADGFEFKPNRSLTPVVGTKIEFPWGISVNLEGYFKHVYALTYPLVYTDPGGYRYVYYNDGVGKIWGIDLMLKKMESRRLDGWLTYSFNYSQRRHPSDGYDDWFYPDFHRFNTLNLVLNYKPTQRFNIFTTFGFASGVPKSYRDQSRIGRKFPLGIKLAFYKFNPQGKVQGETYISFQNIIDLFYQPRDNTAIDQTDRDTAIDMTTRLMVLATAFSFGFRWSF